jgi:hypothetical protein
MRSNCPGGEDKRRCFAIRSSSEEASIVTDSGSISDRNLQQDSRHHDTTTTTVCCGHNGRGRAIGHVARAGNARGGSCEKEENRRKRIKNNLFWISRTSVKLEKYSIRKDQDAKSSKTTNKAPNHKTIIRHR